MLIYTDNPAQRLLDILKSARSHQGHESIAQVWAVVFNIDKGDLPQIFYFLGLLHRVSMDVDERIKQLPNLNHELYLLNMPEIRQALAPNQLNGQWAESLRYLSPHAIRALEFCADALSKQHEEAMISDTELADLTREIQDLYEYIASANLDQQLRLVLLDLLGTMQKAVMEYRIRGAAALRDSIVHSLGTFMLNHELFKKEKNEPAVQKFGNLLAHVTKVVSATLKVKALYDKVQKLLPDKLPEL
jgi:hypothetical protein